MCQEHPSVRISTDVKSPDKTEDRDRWEMKMRGWREEKTATRKREEKEEEGEKRLKRLKDYIILLHHERLRKKELTNDVTTIVHRPCLSVPLFVVRANPPMWTDVSLPLCSVPVPPATSSNKVHLPPVHWASWSLQFIHPSIHPFFLSFLLL